MKGQLAEYSRLLAAKELGRRITLGISRYALILPVYETSNVRLASIAVFMLHVTPLSSAAALKLIEYGVKNVSSSAIYKAASKCIASKRQRIQAVKRKQSANDVASTDVQVVNVLPAKKNKPSSSSTSSASVISETRQRNLIPSSSSSSVRVEEPNRIPPSLKVRITNEISDDRVDLPDDYEIVMSSKFKLISIDIKINYFMSVFVELRTGDSKVGGGKAGNGLFAIPAFDYIKDQIICYYTGKLYGDQET